MKNEDFCFTKFLIFVISLLSEEFPLFFASQEESFVCLRGFISPSLLKDKFESYNEF
jgi:hypothetical protein